MFGKVWGLHFVYEFFNHIKLIDGDDYQTMKENLAFLKFAFMKVMSNNLWKLTFIHSWPNSKDDCITLPEKTAFDKTFQMDYKQANALFESFPFDLKGSERIEEEIIQDEKSKDDYIVPPFYSEKTPYIKEGAKIGRNDSCPCGSGKKYKNCCLNK